MGKKKGVAYNQVTILEAPIRYLFEISRGLTVYIVACF